MTVRVIIGDEAIEKAQSKPAVAKLEMIIRRTMDGDYMIMDHADVDIIVMPKKMKVVAFPKNLMSDLVYSTENRLFKFLSKKGLISVSSIQAGSIYGSLEAKMLEGETHDTVKLTLLNIQKWIEEERPYFENIEADIKRYMNCGDSYNSPVLLSCTKYLSTTWRSPAYVNR